MLPSILLRDWLKHDRLPRELYARLLAPGGLGSPERLFRAYAQSDDPAFLARLAGKLGPALVAKSASASSASFPSPSPLTRTLLLKAPGPGGERGVLLSYFEYNWAKLMRGIPEYAAFARRYTVVLLPSWSPTRYDLLAEALRKTPPEQPVHVQPANDHERAKLAAFHPRLRPTPGLACDWVDPGGFEPRPWAERDIDLLVVSNWAPFKRHWELFRTLARMPRELRVVCVGQPDSGRTLDDIRRLQREFRAPQEIAYLESIPVERVHALQCRAKVSALFSRWEGGCVAAVEALMAGSVLAMRDDARIGARAHVNAETGVTFRGGSAADRLMEALERGGEMRPRRWAETNIAAGTTLARLNRHLREASEREGLPWTEDLAPMCYRPYLSFVDEADYERLAPAAEELRRNHPAVFAESWLEKARR